MSVQVRKAEKKDYMYIMDMYWSCLDEIGEKNLDEEKMLTNVIHCNQKAPCFLLVNDDIICGMAGFRLCPSSHNGDVRLTDYCFYVYPKYRTLGNLSKLVESAQAHARAVKLPLYVNFLTRGNKKLRERLLRMHGFEIDAVVGLYNG